jgi:hypothetical protein
MLKIIFLFRSTGMLDKSMRLRKQAAHNLLGATPSLKLLPRRDKLLRTD